jgi:hypothetical protein
LLAWMYTGAIDKLPQGMEGLKDLTWWRRCPVAIVDIALSFRQFRITHRSVT